MTGVTVHRTERKLQKLRKRRQKMLTHKANIKLGFYCTWFNFPTFRLMETHSASYARGTWGSFPGGKTAWAWSWLRTSI